MSTIGLGDRPKDEEEELLHDPEIDPQLSAQLIAVSCSFHDVVRMMQPLIPSSRNMHESIEGSKQG